jgi:hypothetical protein
MAQVAARKRITVIKKKLGDDDVSAEIAYWQSRSPAARFARVWELTQEAYGLAGREGQSRLQRSVVRIRRA